MLLFRRVKKKTKRMNRAPARKGRIVVNMMSLPKSTLMC